MKRQTMLIAVSAMAVGAFAWWGGTAMATHDDPDVVHLCTLPTGRVTSIVDDPADCARPETAVHLAAASAITALEAQLADQQAAFEAELAGLNTRLAALETLLDGVSLDFDYTPGQTVWRFEGGLFATGDATTGGTGNFGDLLATNVYFAGDLEIDGDMDVAGTVTGGEDATVLVDGNLQVVNGTGTTAGDPNGEGNIIIGYNYDTEDTRTGSHNLVVGDGHTYTSHSGIVAGWNNTLTGLVSFVAGGEFNTASGDRSFVAGGYANTASGLNSSVGGGQANVADGTNSFVGGGFSNLADDAYAFVGGGSDNWAFGQGAFIGGGQGNWANGTYSFVGGGDDNWAEGSRSFIGGGADHNASGFHAFVGGGQADTAGPGTCGYIADVLIGSC